MDSPRPHAAAVLVAAGSSRRMGGELRKPLVALHGRTVLEHAAAAFACLPELVELVLVAHADDLQRVVELSQSSPVLSKVTRVVAGGAARSDSVRNGVLAVSSQAQVICVHDAARCLIESATISAAIAVAADQGAALVAVPVTDTIKHSRDGLSATETLDRGLLWSAQTPQCFRAELLRQLVLRAEREGFRPTDDASLHERYIGPVPLVRGTHENLKITTPADLALAEIILRRRLEGSLRR